MIVASDFFTVEVWTPKGLTRCIVLFFMELSTRRVEIGGIASQADGLWMAQIARNLTDDVDGFFNKKRYFIHDRDPVRDTVSNPACGSRDRISQTAAAIAEFERVCRTVCPKHQGELSGAADGLICRLQPIPQMSNTFG